MVLFYFGICLLLEENDIINKGLFLSIDFYFKGKKVSY